MNKFRKLKQSIDMFIGTLITVALLLGVVVAMTAHVYKEAKGDGFEGLHLETQQIKRNLNLQMLSDRENLITMANFASELYEKGEGYDLLFSSFEKIGLFDNIGLILPDDTVLTKNGVSDASGMISFKEEAAKGAYITGRVESLTFPGLQVVRSCVPVVSKDGETVAVLYGLIRLDTLKERYADDAEAINAKLYVIEGGTGNYIIDTRHESIGSITVLEASSFEDGYSYDKLIEDISNGQSGYCAYMAQTGNELLYAHYSPLDFSDWQIMLSQPEDVVFADARSTSNYLTSMAAVIILIMIFYILFLIVVERKKLKINVTASSVRRRLLEINQQFDKIYDALKMIAEFSGSRSAFVMDTYGEEYNYIMPSLKDKELTGDERKYFVKTLLNFAAKQRTEQGATVRVAELVTNNRFSKIDPEFRGFLKEHNIEKVLFAVVVTNSSNISVIGVINPKKSQANELVRDVAVCFSMAVHNNKYLARTEEMAFGDALTGVRNRMAYKNDIGYINEKECKDLICVYIDVNELHYFNGQYGHAAGDQMLVFIAEAVKYEFSEENVYRMGGDEFLVLARGIGVDAVTEKMRVATRKIEEMKYHISYGIKQIEENMPIEEMVNEAEKIMRDAKARYYQNREVKKIPRLSERKMEADFTGIKEIDAFISVMSVTCLGIFCVSHKADKSTQILSPAYFSDMIEAEGSFTGAVRKYTHELVKPEYHRALFSLLDYEDLGRQLSGGVSTKVTYTKIDGEAVALSVYSNAEKPDDDIDTVWVFEKAETV